MYGVRYHPATMLILEARPIDVKWSIVPVYLQYVAVMVKETLFSHLLIL
jgi:hypothetical protein